MSVSLDPVFYLDRKARPALAFADRATGRVYRATLACCEGGCSTFVLGPRDVDGTVRVCNHSVDCPKNDSITFTVCADCDPPCGTTIPGRRVGDGGPARPLPPTLAFRMTNLTPSSALSGPLLNQFTGPSPCAGWEVPGPAGPPPGPYPARPFPAVYGVLRRGPAPGSPGGTAYVGRFRYLKYRRRLDQRPNPPAVDAFRVTVDVTYCPPSYSVALSCESGFADVGYGCPTPTVLQNCQALFREGPLNEAAPTAGQGTPGTTTYFAADPLRHVAVGRSDAGTLTGGAYEFEFREDVPYGATGDPCPSPPPAGAGFPSAPAYGFDVAPGGGATAPRIPTGQALRLTSSTGLNLTAPWAYDPAGGNPGRATFELRDGSGVVVAAWRLGNTSWRPTWAGPAGLPDPRNFAPAYVREPGNPFSQSSPRGWATLAGPDRRGGAAVLPCVTASFGPCSLTFRDGLGDDYEVTAV